MQTHSSDYQYTRADPVAINELALTGRYALQTLHNRCCLQDHFGSSPINELLKILLRAPRPAHPVCISTGAISCASHDTRSLFLWEGEVSGPPQEKNKREIACRTSLSSLLRRESGKCLLLIFIRALDIARDVNEGREGGREGGKRKRERDDSATFIIKSRLLAFTPRRNDEIQDPRRYTVAHRAILTFKTYLDETEREEGGRERGERDTRRSTPIRCSKLWRRVSLLRMEANVRSDDIIKS